MLTKHLEVIVKVADAQRSSWSRNLFEWLCTSNILGSSDTAQLSAYRPSNHSQLNALFLGTAPLECFVDQMFLFLASSCS